jgi:tripartite-type tricarboxylate transporter receptor subunit TctC
MEEGVMSMLARAVMVSAVALSTAAQAQQYPSKPVRVIVSFTPGASIDLSARAIGQRMGESLGQPFVVENRAGGNTIVSAELAAKAPADGYTIFHPLDTTMTLVPALYDKVGYDPVRDFSPIGQITLGSYILVAPARAAYRTLPELIAHAKANPGKLNFGASTAFTQLLTVMLRQAAGVDVTYVPYKGGPPMIQALLAGEIDLTVDGIPLYVGLVKAGKAAPLAVTGTARAYQFPNTPTIREAGYPQLEAHSWTAWFAPAKTPEVIVRRLNTEMNKVLNDVDFRQKNVEAGQNPLVPSTPEELGELMRQGIAKWGPLVKASGIKLD